MLLLKFYHSFSFTWLNVKKNQIKYSTSYCKHSPLCAIKKYNITSRRKWTKLSVKKKIQIQSRGGVNSDCICRCSEKNSIERNDNLDTVCTPRRALLHGGIFECNVIVCVCIHARVCASILTFYQNRTGDRTRVCRDYRSRRVHEGHHVRGPCHAYHRGHGAPHIHRVESRSSFGTRVSHGLRWNETKNALTYARERKKKSFQAQESEQLRTPMDLDTRLHVSLLLHIHDACEICPIMRNSANVLSCLRIWHTYT